MNDRETLTKATDLLRLLKLESKAHDAAFKAAIGPYMDCQRDLKAEFAPTGDALDEATERVYGLLMAYVETLPQLDEPVRGDIGRLEVRYPDAEVKVDDIEAVPGEYLKTETVEVVDGAKILEAHERGEEVPGVTVVDKPKGVSK